jgi:hypothetical protein
VTLKNGSDTSNLVTIEQLYFKRFFAELVKRIFVKVCAELIFEDQLSERRSAEPSEIVFGQRILRDIDTCLYVNGHNFVTLSYGSVEQLCNFDLSLNKYYNYTVNPWTLRNSQNLLHPEFLATYPGL